MSTLIYYLTRDCSGYDKISQISLWIFLIIICLCVLAVSFSFVYGLINKRKDRKRFK